ncbi:hypothetical protein HELRODRAFT_92436, partial [Helobdella robusta]|uniref:Fibrinogen C-terminal domain-containing protein n=1 Tax=Helobdella robusta TaxID=6412 RepID=T1G8G3_HELRO
WIVIQQRIDGSTDFYQNWNAYKSGFGTYHGNFWLGLEKMHQLTASADYRLRFEVQSSDGWVSDEYDHFKINSEIKKYSLSVSGYWGANNDILNSNDNNHHNGMKFSTFDQINTPNGFDCASTHLAGNWFNYCFNQNVNGRYDVSFKYIFNKTRTRCSACRMLIKKNL